MDDVDPDIALTETVDGADCRKWLGRMLNGEEGAGDY